MESKTNSRCKFCKQIKPVINSGGRCMDCWLEHVQFIGLTDDGKIRRYKKEVKN